MSLTLRDFLQFLIFLIVTEYFMFNHPSYSLIYYNNLLYYVLGYFKDFVRIIFNDNIYDKLDFLSHSLHIWYEFTEPVTEFCDWLLENVYLMKNDK